VESCDVEAFFEVEESEDAPWLEIVDRDEETSDRSLVMEEDIDEREFSSLILSTPLARVCECCDGLGQYQCQNSEIPETGSRFLFDKGDDQYIH